MIGQKKNVVYAFLNRPQISIKSFLLSTSSPSCGWWRARTWLQRSARCNPRWPTCTRGRGPIQPPGTCHRWTDAVWSLGKPKKVQVLKKTKSQHDPVQYIYIFITFDYNILQSHFVTFLCLRRLYQEEHQGSKRWFFAKPAGSKPASPT